MKSRKSLAPGFELFGEGDELYAAMARSIRAANQRVFLASYILAADEAGSVLLEKLMRQSRRGLDVRVHVDALGSASGLARPYRRLLRAAGIRLQVFHRWSWRQPMRYKRRDHPMAFTSIHSRRSQKGPRK